MVVVVVVVVVEPGLMGARHGNGPLNICPRVTFPLRSSGKELMKMLIPLRFLIVGASLADC